MRIVAIDFETANKHFSSACSIGISVFEDGEIISNEEYLIKPHSKYNYFTNSHIHLLTKEDVENEKEFIDYYDFLKDTFKDSILIAHNAPFDLGVLNASCDLYDLPHFNNEYLDTVTLSRRAYPELYNHRLNTIAEYLNISLKHHNAKSDSLASLLILLKVMEAYHVYELNDLLDKLSMKLKVNK